jgi:hypothetical protein
MPNRFQSIIQQKSSDELLEMVYQFTEWDPEMLDGVETELQKRNLLPTDITSRKQKLIADEDQALSNGLQASLTGQIVGWLGVLGLIGLIIGYNYTFSKVRSKYTKKVYYKYDKDSRDNGSYIFYVSLTIFILSVLYTVFKLFGI